MGHFLKKQRHLATPPLFCPRNAHSSPAASDLRSANGFPYRAGRFLARGACPTSQGEEEPWKRAFHTGGCVFYSGALVLHHKRRRNHGKELSILAGALLARNACPTSQRGRGIIEKGFPYRLTRFLAGGACPIPKAEDEKTNPGKGLSILGCAFFSAGRLGGGGVWE